MFKKHNDLMAVPPKEMLGIYLNLDTDRICIVGSIMYRYPRFFNSPIRKIAIMMDTSLGWYVQLLGRYRCFDTIEEVVMYGSEEKPRATEYQQLFVKHAERAEVMMEQWQDKWIREALKRKLKYSRLTKSIASAPETETSAPVFKDMKLVPDENEYLLVCHV